MDSSVERFTIDEGAVQIAYPDGIISAQSYYEIEGRLQILLTRLRRRAGIDETMTVFESDMLVKFSGWDFEAAREAVKEASAKGKPTLEPGAK